MQHFKETQHTTTTTQSKSFQEYYMSGKHNKKIKHIVKTTYKSTNLGFNIKLLLHHKRRLSVETYNKSEHVFANTTPYEPIPKIYRYAKWAKC